MHPFHYQELEHLETILRTGQQGNTTGGLIQISHKEVRLELVLPGAVTDWDYDKLGDCVTNSWLKAVWKYCREHGMQLKDSLPELKLARDNDHFLMQAFVRKNYSSSEL